MFGDDARLSLRAQVNLRRVLEAYGDRTAVSGSAKPSRSIQSGCREPRWRRAGRDRIRVPERGTGRAPSAPSPGVFTSELDEEPSAKPNGSSFRSGVTYAISAGTRRLTGW